MVFYWFFTLFSIPVTCKKPCFSMEKQGFLKVPAFRIWVWFSWIWGANLLVFSIQNLPKSVKNSIPGGVTNSIDFCFDFLWILAPFWGPCGSHAGYQNAAGTLPRRSKTPPGRSKRLPRRPRTAARQPKRPQEAPGRLHDRFFTDFSLIFHWVFHRLFIDFSLMFQRFS